MFTESTNPQLHLELMQYDRERVRSEFQDAQSMFSWLTLQRWNGRIAAFVDQARTMQARWQQRSEPSPPYQMMDCM